MANQLYQEIVNEIEQKIEDGILKVGDKLPPERDLAHRKQVSRNVVREAIKVLKEKGLVTIKHGRGAFITNPSNDILTNSLQNIMHKYDTNLDDILEVREELELLIVKKVIERATPENINVLDRLCKEMDDAKHRINKFIELDFQFHMALAEATQNKIFYVLAQTFFELSERELIDITRYTNDTDVVQDHHYELVAAIKSKDEEKATSIIKQHIHSTKNNVNNIK